MKFIQMASAMAILVGGAGAALAGGPVITAPEPAPMPAPAPMLPANGDWTGLSAGLSLGYGSVTNGAANGTGAIYGLRGGYDQDFGNWVFGGTASYDWSNITAGGDLNNLARLGLRGGYDMGDTLIYATGGAAWADVTTSGVSARDTGWFAGIGAEHKFNESWSVDGQLLTNQFADFNGSGSDLKATTVSLGLNYRF